MDVYRKNAAIIRVKREKQPLPFWLTVIGFVFGAKAKHQAWFSGRRDYIHHELHFRRIAVLHDGVHYRLNPIVISSGDVEQWPFPVDFPPPRRSRADSIAPFLGRRMKGPPPSGWHVINTDHEGLTVLYKGDLAIRLVGDDDIPDSERPVPPKPAPE